jgi:hypothetical protein
MAPYRVREVRDLVTEGQEIMVRVVEIGDDGKIRLSHKEFAQPTPPPGYDTGGGSGGGGGDRPYRSEGERRDRPREGGFREREGGFRDRDRGGDRDRRPGSGSAGGGRPQRTHPGQRRRPE